jgi:hypothetical protein
MAAHPHATGVLGSRLKPSLAEPAGLAFGQAALLFAATVAVFLPTLGAEFVYDARIQILTDPFIHDPKNWPSVLSLRVLGMDVLDFNRPVMLASLMLDAGIWGRESVGYHLTSIFIHAVNAVLLWMVIQACLTPALPARVVQPVPPLKSARGVAMMLAALLFAVHPIVTEAVCEPTFREDLLVALFSLAALVLALRHDARSRSSDPWRALGCTACCLLAVGSKESGIAAPLLLACYWLLCRRDDPGRFWPWTVSAAHVVSLAFLASRFLLAPGHSKIFATPPSYLGGSLGAAIPFIPRIYALYGQLLLFPVNQHVDYGDLSIAHLPLPVALVVLAIVVVLAGLAARRDSRLFLAYAMVLLPLLPVSNLIPIFCPVADRYLYLPMAGVALAVAIALDRAQLMDRGRVRTWSLLGCAAVVAVLTVACIQRQMVWTTPVIFWEDTLRKNPGSITASIGYGEALLRVSRFEEAERVVMNTIRATNGRIGNTWSTLAIVFDRRGDSVKARRALAKAIEVEPRLVDPDACVAALMIDRPTADDLKRLLGQMREGEEKNDR